MSLIVVSWDADPGSEESWEHQLQDHLNAMESNGAVFVTMAERTARITQTGGMVGGTMEVPCMDLVFRQP